MFEYRIANCDPAIRSEGGKYTEWTSFSDVGATFDGKVLTQSAFEEVEAAYIAVATAFLREADAGFRPGGHRAPHPSASPPRESRTSDIPAAKLTL